MKRNLLGIVFLLAILSGFKNHALAQLPTITPGTIANTCAGTNSVLPFSTTGFPLTYSITWAGTPVGLPDVPPGTIIPTISLPIVVFSSCATGIYNGMITVTNGTGTSNPKPITITVYGLPSSYTITGGGAYCAGGTGVHIGLSNSSSGVLYQLYRGGITPVGSAMWGTGTALDFGLQTFAGAYTVQANDPTSTCTRAMTGTVNVVSQPVPAIAAMTGGGGYCSGSFGVPVGLTASSFGVYYQLYRAGTTPVGSPIPGTGLTLDFGAQTIGGIYTAIAIDSTYPACPANMTGTAGVYVYPVPNVYTVTGGGNYCAGGYGMHVGLSNSNTTISYSLFKGSTFLYSTNGTGGPMDFGLFTGAGNYTVKGANLVYGCAAMMADTAVIGLYLPVVPHVSITSNNGSSVCAANTDTFSVSGVLNGGTAPTYQWGLNGIDIAGETGSTFSYVPLNIDNLTLKMTSNAQCATPSLATAEVTISVANRIVPSVHIFSSLGSSFTNGQSVTLSALLTSPGPTPSFQWFVNGALVAGATSSLFTSSSFADLDSISCRVYGCSDTAGFGSLRVNVIPRLGIKQVSTSGNDIHIFPNPSKGSFTINGIIGNSVAGQDVSIKIADMLGKVVYSGNITVSNGKINEKVQLPNTIGSGMYMLTLLTQTGNVVSQIVIE